MAMFNSTPLCVALVASGLLLYVTSTHSSQAPLINTTPFDAAVPEGQNLTIQCDSTSKVASVVLEINRLPVSDGNPRFTPGSPNDEIYNKTWIFLSVSRSDNGANFTCFSQSLNARSQEVMLSVLFAPNISSLTTNVVVPEGGSVNATFTVDANPDVTKTGIRVTPLEPKNVLIIDGSNVILVYKALQIGSNNGAGLQYLNVTNSVDSVVAIFTLDVYDFAENSGDIQVNEGDTLRVDCSVVESTPGIVESVTISGYGISGMMTLPSDNRIYEVAMATLALNGTTFTCTASNGGTMTQIMYTVTVTKTFTSSTTMTVIPSSSMTYIEPSNTPTSDGPGLGGGAIAGIVIGVVMGTILVVLLL